MLVDPSKSSAHHEPQPRVQPRRVLALVAAVALVLLGVLLLFSMAVTVSRRVSILTSAENALAGTAVAVAAILVLLYPLWPGRLLGGDPVQRFGAWFLLRLVEVVLVLAVAVPFLLAAAILSGAPLWSAARILAGLSGTAVVAVLYRFAHQAGSRRLRGVALFDTILFVFGPLAVGYLALEFNHFSIAWGWLISPLALARDVALRGLPLGSPSFLLGVVGYTVAALVGLVIARPLARRFSEERRRELEQ